MPTITSLGIKITGDASQFAAEAEKAVKIARATSNAISGITGQLGRIARGIDLLPQRTATANVDALGAAVVKVGIAMQAVKAMRWGLQLAVETERATLTWTTLIGTQKEALALQKYLRDTVVEGRSGPFDYRTMQMAAHQLLVYRFNLQDIPQLLRTLADAGAAFPDKSEEAMERVIRAFGQMKAKGRVQAEEMRQLAELGINAWDSLAQALGTNVAGAMHKVHQNQVSASMGIMAVLQQMERQFKGVAEARADTLEGRWTQLKGGTQMALAAFLDEFLKGTGLKDALKDVGTWVRGNVHLFKEWGAVAARVAKVIWEGFRAAGAAVQGVYNVMKFLFGDILTQGLSVFDRLQVSVEKVRKFVEGLFWDMIEFGAAIVDQFNPAVWANQLNRGMYKLSADLKATFASVDWGTAPWNKTDADWAAQKARYDAMMTRYNKIIEVAAPRYTPMQSQARLARRMYEMAQRESDPNYRWQKALDDLMATTPLVGMYDKLAPGAMKLFTDLKKEGEEMFKGLQWLTIAAQAKEDQRRIEVQTALIGMFNRIQTAAEQMAKAVESTVNPMERFRLDLLQISPLKTNPLVTEATRQRLTGQAFLKARDAFGLGERRDNRAIMVGSEDYRTFVADTMAAQRSQDVPTILRQIEALSKQQSGYLEQIGRQLQQLGVVNF